MSNKISDKAIKSINFLFDGIMIDADVRNYIRDHIYPLHLEIGKHNIKLLEELLHVLVWKMNCELWFRMSPETTEKYNCSSPVIKIVGSNCKALGLTESLDKFIFDVSINGQPTLLELDLNEVYLGNVRLYVSDDDIKEIPLSNIATALLTNLIREFSEDNEDKTTVGDMMESVEDNVVKVDFSKKTKH